MDQPSAGDRELAARVDAEIEARWQAAQRRHGTAMAAIEHRRRTANLRFGLVLLGSAVVIGAAALLPSWLGR